MGWGLLDALSACERDEFMSHACRRHYPTDTYLWQAGDPADCLHVIANGCVAITVPLASGQVGLIDILGPGGHCGEVSIIVRRPTRSTSVVALRSTTTYTIHSTVFNRFSSHARVQQALTHQLATRVIELQRNLVEQMYCTLEARLLSRLVRLAAVFGHEVPLTQAQIAQLTGSTRQSVNHELHQLADRGIVAVLRGRIQILDLPALRGRLEDLQAGHAQTASPAGHAGPAGLALDVQQSPRNGASVVSRRTAS
ncbi:MAG: Crp/Fnr family transcriptional regulator [Nocardioidaceae bacterium]